MQKAEFSHADRGQKKFWNWVTGMPYEFPLT